MIQKKFVKDVRKRKNRALLKPVRSAVLKTGSIITRTKKRLMKEGRTITGIIGSTLGNMQNNKQEHREEINAKARERRAKNYEEE